MLKAVFLNHLYLLGKKASDRLTCSQQESPAIRVGESQEARPRLAGKVGGTERDEGTCGILLHSISEF